MPFLVWKGGRRVIVLDYSDKRPIYEQIVERFRMLILNGVLEADEKLPSVRALAVELSINPNTIQRAYGELERSGFIYSVKGRGNFVCANKETLEQEKEKMLNELMEFVKAYREAGLTLEEVEICVRSVYGEV